MVRQAAPWACLVSGLLLSGCAGGFSLKQAEADPTILTGSVASPAAVAADPSQRSDEMTIRNAVSSADVESLEGSQIPWANAETGSRGTINSLVEEKGPGTVCRRFTTSRESFDGVALFEGQACMVGPGAWRLEKFGAV
ncbi:hypothetical protein KEU06_06510 [Pseudaminobacter sp. 19-2017]|uniref:Surface antigen domain-containing protein n=1 Tax=Pseudaminobacter soli (ex Zhang et al. 2022) TaxID=2831468 RepID=A0A942DWV0_9HYPH|nr:RT0821/Lpp0805 family surface protein [Pseudaminobacter soli]MBS3648277.1 hypothetical protein [Pseudaminobacter soli]